MSAASKILLLIGAGPRIGDGVARAFIEKGYKVALAVSGIFRRSCIQNFELT